MVKGRVLTAVHHSQARAMICTFQYLTSAVGYVPRINSPRTVSRFRSVRCGARTRLLFLWPIRSRFSLPTFHPATTPCQVYPFALQLLATILLHANFWFGSEPVFRIKFTKRKKFTSNFILNLQETKTRKEWEEVKTGYHPQLGSMKILGVTFKLGTGSQYVFSNLLLNTVRTCSARRAKPSFL